MNGTPFFIVGPGRSGTTLLRAILDARDDVRVPGETHFYTTYRLENLVRFHFLSRANYLKAVRNYSEWRHVAYEQIDWGRFADIAGQLPPRRGSILHAYLQACAEAAGATRAGEKTPGHIRALDRIWRDFPEAQVIHVMRDPRAVAASYLNHDLYTRVFRKDVTRAVLKWVEAARMHRRVCDDPRYMSIRYEDLVATPGAVLEQAHKFLDLPHEPDIFEKYQNVKLILPESPNHQNINKPLSSGRTDAWKRQLAAPDIALVDALAGRFLTDFGYEPSGTLPAGPVTVLVRRIGFWLTFARYGSGRLLRTVFQ